MSDDVLDIVYSILIEDKELTDNIPVNNIKYFKYPSTANMSGNWIILEPLVNELPGDYGDETWITYDYLLHIEVWSTKRPSNRKLANRIRDLLWEKLKFSQNDSIDEFDSGIYRDARRYRGTLHRSDLETI